MILGVVAVALLALAKPSAVETQWHLGTTGRQQVVEQQTPGGATQPDPALWVTNPTGCVWDADDYDWLTLAGTLDAGVTVEVTRCVVGDWIPHLAWARSDTEGVNVTVVFGPGASGRSAAAVLGPDYDNGSPLLPPVEGSNGGVGVVYQVTFQATNATGKRIRRVRAVAHIDPGYWSAPCTLGGRVGSDPAWRSCRT